MISFCRKNCKELSPNEKDQSDKKEEHRCARFNLRVFHGSFHPKLLMAGECIRNEEG